MKKTKSKNSPCLTRQMTDEEKEKYTPQKNKILERKVMSKELKIDPEFRDLLPPLPKDTYDSLEKNILQDGCLDAIKTWTEAETENTYIIDGHNRYGICTKHNISFKVESKEFSNRYEVIDWIINFQLDRRNLSVEEKYYLSGLQYENEKKSVSNETGINQHTKEVVGNSYHQPENDNFQAIVTAERIGKQHGVSEKTIRDNGKYANAVNKITELVGTEAKNKILTGEKKVSKDDIIEIGNQIKSGEINKTWLNKQFIESNNKKVEVPKKNKVVEKKDGITEGIKPVKEFKAIIENDVILLDGTLEENRKLNEIGMLLKTKRSGEDNLNVDFEIQAIESTSKNVLNSLYISIFDNGISLENHLTKQHYEKIRDILEDAKSEIEKYIKKIEEKINENK